MKPLVFKARGRWAIRFVLDGREAFWFTPQWADAFTFALNLARLRAEGIGR
jgi:hypothetical protein